jgi:uncharacterized membrane protein YbhN (UPF0104 family)
MAVRTVSTSPDAAPFGALSARRVAVMLAGAALLVASLVLLAPAVGDLPDAWHRLSNGDGRWLLLALVLEALSFLGHAILFRAVGLDDRGRIGLRASIEITLAGHAATRLLASAGAGGVALTAWAMRKSGMERATVAARMTTFLVLLYSVYMGALILGGAGLALGLLPGGGPVAITVVPAVFGAAVIAIVLSAQAIRPGEGRVRRVLAPLGAGVRDARRMVRSRNGGLAGALMWWGFDIAVLWACFEAFGDSPAVAVLVVAYFVGTLANTLPLPGGIGGVEGGMVGALAAFGVDPGLALIAVLAYRGFAFWLPIVPGVISYMTLRRTVAGWEADTEFRREVTDEPATESHEHGLVCGDLPATIPSASWKASASSTTRISRSGFRTWPSRCRASSRSRGLTTPSSSPST